MIERYTIQSIPLNLTVMPSQTEPGMYCIPKHQIEVLVAYILQLIAVVPKKYKQHILDSVTIALED